MKTAAQQLLEEGEARGEARGEIKGQAKALLKFIHRPFGSVPPAVEASIRSATADQLDRWIERVSFANSAEDVVRE